MNKNTNIEKLIIVIKKLRDPKDGCAWDKKQTSISLLPYLLEETYEVIDAIIDNSQENIKEELGDLLFQVVLHSVIIEEKYNYTLNDIIDALNKKIIRRHPHVFKEKKELSDKDLKIQWNKIKKKEKKNITVNNNIIDKNKEIKKTALKQAIDIGMEAKKINFDWKNHIGPLNKIKEEIKEVEIEINKKNIHKNKLMLEIGDLLFSISNLCRHLDINPEISLLMSNNKFIKRLNDTVKQFENIEDFKQTSSNIKEKAWNKAKKLQ